jgi:hypothetical protein
MQAYAADILALAFGALALGAVVTGRFPQREGIAGMSTLRAKGAIVGAGIGAVPASALAYELAGPGVLLWIFLACFLGVALLGRAPAETRGSAPSKLPSYATFVALGLAGAWLARHSAGLDAGWTTPLVLWGVGAITLVLAPPANFNPQWLRTPALLIVVAAAWAVSSSDAGGAFFGRAIEGATDFTALAAGGAGGVAVAWLAVVAQQGLIAGAHSLGLGYVEAQSEVQHARSLAWAAALNAALVSTACVYAIDATQSAPARLDAKDLQTEDGRARLVPVERPHNRMYLPSPEGQTVVLPTDTTLEADHSYRARFRANPRGYKIALYSEERGAYATAKLNSTEGIDHIYFRDKDPARAKNAAWDLRVPVTVEELDVGNATPVLQIKPRDPNLNLRVLEKRYDGPYLPLNDVDIDLVVRKALSGSAQIGEHLAALELKAAGPMQEFSFEQLVPMGFRGPFFDLDRPEAPLAFVADDGLDFELGERLAVEYRAPEAGLEMGVVTRKGELELPAWTELEQLEFVIFHHESGDPARSFMVPVQPAANPMVNGRLRYTSAPDAPTSLHKARKLEGYRGPFLPMAPVQRWVEVRSAKHLVDIGEVNHQQRGVRQHANAHRRVLVPLPGAKAKGLEGSYDATAQELIQAGFRGPFVRSEKGTGAAALGGLGLLAAWLAWAFAAWVALPGEPKLRAGAAAVAVLGWFLPFELLYLLWLASAALLLIAAWPRRARA